MLLNWLSWLCPWNCCCALESCRQVVLRMHHGQTEACRPSPYSCNAFCGISAVVRDVVLKHPGHLMHPSQGSRSCAGLFRLSCLVFCLSRTVLFCHPSVFLCTALFRSFCSVLDLDIVSKWHCGDPYVKILKPPCIHAACACMILYEGLETSSL